MKQITKYFLTILLILFFTSCGGGGGNGTTEINTEEPQATINTDYSYLVTAKIVYIAYQDTNPNIMTQVTYEFEIKDYEPNTNYFVRIFVNGQPEYYYDDFGQLDSYAFQFATQDFCSDVKYEIYDKRAGTLLLSRELDISNLQLEAN